MSIYFSENNNFVHLKFNNYFFKEFKEIYFSADENTKYYDKNHLNYISSVDIFRISIVRQNQTWFALPTEIMNTQTICNIPIDNNVTNMFLTTPQLGMLHNPDNNTSVYPLPDAV